MTVPRPPSSGSLVDALEQVTEKLIVALRREQVTSGQRRLIQHRARRALAETAEARELTASFTSTWRPSGGVLDVELTVHITLAKAE